MRRERVRGGHPFDRRGIRRLRGDGERDAFGLPRPSLTAVHSRASFLTRTRRPAGFRLIPNRFARRVIVTSALSGVSWPTRERTRRSSTWMKWVLDELAAALERAAAKRQAQAPDLTTLGRKSRPASKGLSGGGGNRTRVRGRTARASTSLGCR